MSGKKEEGLEEPVEHTSSTNAIIGDPSMGFTMGSDDDWDDLMTATLPEEQVETMETMPPADEEEAKRRSLEEQLDEEYKKQNPDEAETEEEEDGDSDESESDEQGTGDEDTTEDETTSDEEDSDAEDEQESDEQEDESDDEDDDEDDDTADDADRPKIPKHRFDEVNKRMKAAEEELAALKARELRTENQEPSAPEPVEPPVDEFDYDANEDAYQEALLEGRREDAKALRAEAREAATKHAQAMGRYEAEQVAGENNQQNTISAIAQTIEDAHPEFQANHPNFNKEITEEVIELGQAYLTMAKYKSNPSKALIDASEQVLKIYGVVDADGVRVDSKPREEPKPKKKTNVKQKTKVAKSQPTRTTRKSGGQEEPTIDVENMTESEWDSLPESTKARLRGDFRT